MYVSGPDEADLAAYGLSLADIGEDDVMVFPDCWQSLVVFNSLDTQWRGGMSGPTGLDYAVLQDVFRFNAIPRKEWPALFADIRVMERAALKVIHEKE